jgi:hypothetical protein
MNIEAKMSIHRARWFSFAIGIIGLLVCAIGFTINRRDFFLSYLFGFLVWLGVALGCSGFLMIHHLTGGKWGYPIRRFFEAAISTLPVLALLFVPTLFGFSQLYPWANEATVSLDKVLQHKRGYMNEPGFVIRAVVVFAIWILIAHLLNKWSVEQDATHAVEPTKKLRKLSGPGLVIYPLSVTFAYVDWVMSMEADWYSTIFPLLICVGQMLSALAFVVILIGAVVPSPQSSPTGRGAPFSLGEKVGMRGLGSSADALQSLLGKENFHHLGNLLLTFTMVWAYLAYAQLIVIWSGDLPHEISWYLHRIAGGWRWIAIALLLFHFFGPFFLLLFRQTKRNPLTLVVIAAIIFMTHIIDVWWLVAPSLYQTDFYISWMAPAALAGIGGIWCAFFLRRLETRPLVPLNDPRFAVALST